MIACICFSAFVIPGEEHARAIVDHEVYRNQRVPASIKQIAPWCVRGTRAYVYDVRDMFTVHLHPSSESARKKVARGVVSNESPRDFSYARDRAVIANN